MNLVVKSPVWNDLREIALRISQDNPEAADRFFTAAQDAFDVLKRHPGIGRLRSFKVSGVRSWLVPEFEKYVIFYLPRKTEVQILAVLHGARDLPRVIAERLG
jgi:plasmid stabilization system protein ParE